MTSGTIGIETEQLVVVRFAGSCIILHFMTGIAIGTDIIESQIGGRSMTPITISRFV